MVSLFIMASLHRAPVARSKRINCTNNLKQIGLAFRTWALDHNDKYPAQVSSTNGGSLQLLASGVASSHFRPLSNELSTPKIMVCPADTRRKVATKFGVGFDDQHLSYFVGVDASPTNSQMFLAGDRNMTNGDSVKRPFLNLTTNELAGWTDDLHVLQGNVGLADGSVQQFSKARLREAIGFTGMATNRLVMP
jgi:hypothetical protein